MAADPGTTFAGPGVIVGGTTVKTTFTVVRAPGSALGEVSIGNGSARAIAASAAGSLTIPESVTHDGQRYRIVAVGDKAFRGAVALTSTGLAENRSVTAIGDFAFAGATAITDTGLAGNGVVKEVGTGAFASNRSLRDAALPPSLTAAPSVPFTAAANLTSIYAPSPFAMNKRVGLTTSLPVYYRTGVNGWSSSATSFEGLSLFGPKPSELVPLSAVRVVGGAARLGDGSGDHPYRAATGLFAAAGVVPGGGTGSAAQLVTITATNTGTFPGWKATGVQLTPEQLASPTVTFTMPPADVTLEVASGITVTSSATPRCVSGSVYLAISVTNTSPFAVSLQLSSSYGNKSVPSLGSGKTSSSTLNTRKTSVPAGAVTVEARTTDGRTSTSSAPYAAFGC
ncbi:leucine-rich repeat protein [Microbacteriaceae bacterium VKM Ac-2855]|nr:leucine-rich repeat protein [Microbacteriaceae bacterium VKM Ac-2855]